jgi:hypothetical protein
MLQYSWSADVFWSDNSDTLVTTDHLQLPAPATAQCTPWRPYHAHPYVWHQLDTGEWYYWDDSLR